jgi:hypothetical protein
MNTHHEQLPESAHRALEAARALAEKEADALAHMETGQYAYKEGFVPGLQVGLTDEARSGAAVMLNVLQGRAPFTPIDLPNGGVFTPLSFETPVQD